MGRTGKDVRISLQTLRVLDAFLSGAHEELAVADVARRWEKIDPSVEGRPRRRPYRMTPAGLRRACGGMLGDQHPLLARGLSDAGRECPALVRSSTML